MPKYETELAKYPKREKLGPIPTDSDWKALERYLDFRLPEDFKTFVAEANAHYFEGEIPCVSEDGPEIGFNWLRVIKREREKSGNPIPSLLIPFCGVGNGDYHCFRVVDRGAGTYEVVYWYHDKPSKEQLSNLHVLSKTFTDWLNHYVRDDF